MAKKTRENQELDEFISWRVAEYEDHERTRNWYIGSGIAASLLLIYAVWAANFLFALIVIMAGIIIILNDGQKPMEVTVTLTDEGLMLGKKFYDYDEIDNFSIVYKPKQKVKNVYFEFKSSLRHRLSIPLENVNPLTLREFLLQYMDEDLERTDQPLSEGLARLFKL